VSGGAPALEATVIIDKARILEIALGDGRAPPRVDRGQPLAADRGQHLVKEPTELGGTRRYSCETANPLRTAEMLVSVLLKPSLTRKRSEVQVL